MWNIHLQIIFIFALYEIFFSINYYRLLEIIVFVTSL